MPRMSGAQAGKNCASHSAFDSRVDFALALHMWTNHEIFTKASPGGMCAASRYPSMRTVKSFLLLCQKTVSSFRMTHPYPGHGSSPE